MEKRRWPLVSWLRFAKLLFSVLEKGRSETLPYSSFPQKATMQLTSHNQPHALEGANFRKFLQDRESVAAGSRGAKQAREKRAVLSALSSAVWFLMVGVSGISSHADTKLFRRVDCQKRSSAS